MMALLLRVQRTSNSNPFAPCSKARSKAVRVFSGAYRRAPRWPSSRMRLVEVKVADSGLVRSFFGFLDGLLEFLFQQVSLVLLCIYGLAEQGFLAPFLLAHGFGCSF